jgi:hypothetical protein
VAPPIRPAAPPLRESPAPAPAAPSRPAGAPAIRDVSAPIAQQRSGAPRPGAPAARAGGRDVTGPVGPRPATGAQPLPPRAAETRLETVKRALRWDVNKRYALLVVGAAVLFAAAVVGVLAQRSCAIAGHEGEDRAAEETLARRKLLEEGGRLLVADRPAEARAKFLELVRLAPESVAARDALQRAEALLAKKQEMERRAAEAGAYLAEARQARASSDWARAIVEADGALAADPANAEAKEIKEAAEAEIAKKGRAARKKAADQIRALRAAPKPKPTAAPEPTVPAPAAPVVAPHASAAPVPATVRLRIAFRATVPEGYVMIRRNDVEIWRRAFDFGRKSGGGSLEGEVEVASGRGEFKVWVIATDRSVNEYQVVPLNVGEGRTLALDVDARGKLAVSLR